MSTQTPDPRQWCDDLQTRLMAAMDAAWRVADTSKDPAEVAKALAKAKLCGQFAAAARKIAAMTPAQAKPVVRAPAKAPPHAEDDAEPAAIPQTAIARTALQRLKAGGGRRGRL